MTKFYYFTAIICLTIIASACSNEMEQPQVSNNNHPIELRIAVRSFISNADNDQTDQEAAVRNLALFLFDADGQEVVQTTRNHTIQDSKVFLDIETANIKGPLKVYAIANEIGVADTPITESELLEYKSQVSPTNFITNGFPMSSNAVTIQKESPQTSAAVTLERVPSAIYVQVDTSEFEDGSEAITNNSYKVEVEGLQVTEGAMFRNVASSLPTQGRTDYSSKLSSVNTPENIAYFYQSPQIKIHITPSNAKLGNTKTITIDAEKSQGRNKKFLVQIKPIKVPTVEPVTRVGFTVSVSEWDTEVIVVEVPESVPEITPDPAPEQGEDVVLFAEGVNTESGWYDINKSKGLGGFSIDSYMCWALTETNMIQWWQDRYVASGKTLPPGVPNGFIPGRENANYRQLAIFEIFYVPTYKNNPGSVLKGLPTYFTTYFPDIFPNKDPFFTEGTYAKSMAVKDLKGFSDFVVNAFKDRGVVSLGLPGHDTTLWGVTYNTGTGLVKNVFMSDSDDMDNGEMYVGIWERRSVKVNPTTGTISVGGKTIDAVCTLYAYPGKTK